ncbi:MAG: hypothetical protein RR255_00525 [Bacilli bacterium]
MEFNFTSTWGFMHAIRGMRNPLESWNKCDSRTYNNENYFILGKNDSSLMQRLILSGSDHSKFMRQIMASVDITAPMYWWSEFDTYKVGTVANSTSKMHKLATTPITIDCFECDKDTNTEIWDTLINRLEDLRLKYLETKDKRYWRELLQLLPNSWLQKRTVVLSYQVLRNMYFARRNHKLTEWSVDFVEWVKTLPYTEELIIFDLTKDK